MPRKRGVADAAAEWPATERQVSELVASLLMLQKRLEASQGVKASKSRLDATDWEQLDSSEPLKDPDITMGEDDMHANLEPLAEARTNLTKRRMELREVLKGCGWEVYRNLIESYRENTQLVALSLIDCPEALRLNALEKIRDNRRTQILDEMTRIEIDKETFDPYNIFPSVVTRKLITMLPFQIVPCLICEYEFEDGEDVIWKNCNKHLMHSYCVTKMFQHGLVPLFGSCPCIENHEVGTDASAE